MGEVNDFRRNNGEVPCFIKLLIEMCRVYDEVASSALLLVQTIICIQRILLAGGWSRCLLSPL